MYRIQKYNVREPFRTNNHKSSQKIARTKSVHTSGEKYVSKNVEKYL